MPRGVPGGRGRRHRCHTLRERASGQLDAAAGARQLVTVVAPATSSTRASVDIRFHHVPCGSPPPFRVTDEDMSHSPTSYRHLAFIRFNTDPVVPGRGSGIFLHVSSGRPTLGCVALPLPNLLTILRRLRPELKPSIAIGTADQLAGD